MLYRLLLFLDNRFLLLSHHRASRLFHGKYYRGNRTSCRVHQVLFLLVVTDLPHHPDREIRQPVVLARATSRHSVKVIVRYPSHSGFQLQIDVLAGTIAQGDVSSQPQVHLVIQRGRGVKTLVILFLVELRRELLQVNRRAQQHRPATHFFLPEEVIHVKIPV